MKAIRHVAVAFTVILITAVFSRGDEISVAPSVANDGTTPSAVKGETLDFNSLETMLLGLGYLPERVEKNGFVMYWIKVQSQHGANVQALALDPVHNNVVLLGGGFMIDEALVRDAAAVYRKMLVVCEDLENSKISITAKGQMLLQSYLGNARITPALLKTSIDDNLRAVDDKLFPLWEALHVQTAATEASGTTFVQSGSGQMSHSAR